MTDLSRITPQASSAYERLIQSWGGPLSVTSGYRSPEYNQRVGGAKQSQHMHGNAYDVSTQGMTRDQQLELIRMAQASGFGGVGVYDGSLHFDVGPQRAWGPDYTRKSLPDWAASALGVSSGGGADMVNGGDGGDRLMNGYGNNAQPRGLLEMLGIQKRDKAAGGETALPFYQRGSFKDTMGNLAVGLNSLRLNPDPNLAARVGAGQERRQEAVQGSKTAQWLAHNGRTDLASAVESGSLGAKDAISIFYTAPKDNSTALMQNYEYALRQGMTPEQARQWVSSGTTVNVGGADDKFGEAFAKDDAATLAQVSAAGMQAMRNMGRIDQLDALLQAAPAGATGYIKSVAGEFGINTDGLDEIQAAQALINSLVPEQRQAGSGPMSDADLALFKQSLPRIINQPNGNAMIISTMRKIAQYDADGAAIVQQLRAGEIDRQTAFQMLQGRENPLATFTSQVPTMSPEDAANILLQQ